MTDHLGNVLTTVLDRKTGAGTRETLGNTMYEHWSADLASVADYYPGGMMMPGRNTEHDWSRMGYNGQAKDDEVYGKGNLNTALVWEMDTRILRRWNLDPKPNESISNYAVFNGNPIRMGDWLGDTVRVSNEIKNDAFWSKAYDKWSKTKEGKSILKNYDIGGKYEKTNINFKIADIGDAEGQTIPLSVDKTTGSRTKLYAGDELGENSRLEFDILLSASRSVPNSSEFLVKKYLNVSLIKPLGTLSGIETIGHEIQHLQLDHSAVLANRPIQRAYDQHLQMRDQKGSLYMQRRSIMNQNRDLWYNNFLDQRRNGGNQSEEDYIRGTINDFRN